MEVISSKSFEEESSEEENNQNDNFNYNSENYYEQYSKNKLDYNNISEDEYNEELDINEIGNNSNDIEMNGINEINELDEDGEETDRNMEGHYEENEISNSMKNVENNTINTIDEENDEYNENSMTNTINNTNNNININENINDNLISYNNPSFPMTSVTSNQIIKMLIESNITKQIPLIMFNNDKFAISEEAKNLFNLIGNYKIGIISLLGQYNSIDDKYFLLNKITSDNEEIELLDNKNNSEGILLYSKPLIIKNNFCEEEFPCFIIDKIHLDINLDNNNDNLRHDNQIFLIIILLSSLFIFNSIGAIDRTAFANLDIILKIIKTIKIKSTFEEENGKELSEFLPALIWVLQNSNLKLEDKNGNTLTEKQYMEKELELANGSTDSIEEKNRITTMIKNYFPERDCFIMMNPYSIQDDKDNNILEKYTEQITVLKNKVIKKAKPKTFYNNFITGNMLIELIDSILNSINAGGVPVLSNSWNYIMKSECEKYANNLVYKFVNELKEYRNENINKNIFFDDNQIDKYKIKMVQKYMKEYMNNDFIDEEVKQEFSEKMKNKLGMELKNYQKENEKIFEEKFTKDLNLLSNKFMENFTSSDIYEKNSYKFFQDFENFREAAVNSSPDFPRKNEILFDKVLLIIKKFINGKIMKIKVINEEKSYLENENKKQEDKINELNKELLMIKEKNNEFIMKLNNDIQMEKKNYKRIEDKMNGLINNKTKELENLKKEIEIETNNYENKIKEIIETNNNLDKEIKVKDEQLIVMKMNNEKISSLYEQKSEYLKREISNWKDKYTSTIKEAVNKENDLNKENLKLKEQNKLLIRKEKNKSEEMRNHNINNSNSNSINKNNINISNNNNNSGNNAHENININVNGISTNMNNINILSNGKENISSNNESSNNNLANTKPIKTNINGLMNYIKMNFKDKKGKMLKLDKFFLNHKKESQELLKEKSLGKESKNKIKKEENKNNNIYNSDSMALNKKENNLKSNELKKNAYSHDTNNSKDNKKRVKEGQFLNFSQYKEIINNAKDFKCKFCLQLFNFPEFKEHYNLCSKNPINMTNMNNSNVQNENDNSKERNIRPKKNSNNNTNILLSEKMNSSHIENELNNDNLSMNKSNIKKFTISNSSINTNHNSSVNNVINNTNLNNSNINNLNNNGNNIIYNSIHLKNKKENSYSNNNITNITNANTSGTNNNSDNVSMKGKNNDKKNYYRNINLYYYTNDNNSNSKYKSNVNNNNTFVPKKLKIKIIKGRIRKDKSGKPYLEYLINLNYDNIQNWNINRRFNQFTNLYKTLRTLCKGNFELPESANMFNNINALFSGLSHENKIFQLEKFLKDLVETEGINNYKHLYCFLELNHLIDENNNILYNNYNGILNSQPRRTFDSIPKNKSNNILLVNNKHNYNSAGISGNISSVADTPVNSNIATNRFKLISRELE